jgi:PAS domain S-box-containing protein
MGFEPWGSLFVPILNLPGRWEVYLVLAVYVVSLVVVLVRSRRDFLPRGWRIFLFALFLALAPVLNVVLVVRFESIDILPPYIAIEPVSLALPLLGLLPIALSAAWLGVGPALIVGLLTGLFRAGTTTHNPLEPFDLALVAILAASFLRQDYRGRLAAVFRQPLVALPVACVFAVPVAIFSAYFSVYRSGGGVDALDYALALQQYRVPLALVESLIHGLILQSVYMVIPRARPVTTAERSPPYARTLNRRLLSVIIPVFILLMAVSIILVYIASLSGATSQAVTSLARDSAKGAAGALYFISTGQSLSRQFATDPALWSGDPDSCRAQLQSDLQMLAYFSRLTAYDSDGNVLCTYPEGSQSETTLTFEEEEELSFTWTTGGLSVTPVHRGLDGEVYFSFLSRVEDPQSSQRFGVLVGRVQIKTSPLLNDVLDGLQQTMEQGEGFIVDDRGRIVAYVAPDEGANPGTDRYLEYWAVDQSRPPVAEVLGGQGWVRESRDSTTNTRQFVCYVALEGHPWAVVILLPYDVVLGQAIGLAGPLLATLVVLTVAVSIVTFVVTRQLTRPLDDLARASDRIALGDLEQPVDVTGDDEISNLAKVFENMRTRLKDRLDDLSLLLRVGQEVSAALDLTKGMPPLLEGALKATDALISRVVLFSATGEPQMVMGRGESVEGVGVLDQALGLAARESGSPLVIDDLSRSRSLAEFGSLPPKIRAAIALPVRGRRRTVAVMWVGYAEPRSFTAAEMDLLSTLASQAAVLVENARLFQMAEGGRRRLAAILTSTSDAVLVTDREGVLLLINPAAEQTLGLKTGDVVNTNVADVPLEPALVRVLTESIDKEEHLVEEVPLPNNRTLYASASTIMNADEDNIGRVVVMRDVTHFKQLDEMKSEFVSTVSHDLRSPLTFVRGYASMLPMVGELNEKQQEYMDKILIGVEQMGNLVEDLLNLGRIEAGVGLEEKPCHLGALVVEAVDGMRARAAAKGLLLRLQSSDSSPVIMGDVTLLRQAVVNLVDNAIKYTPTGGTISVGLRSSESEAAVSVTDTGIGIAPEDQVRLFEKFFRIRRQETSGVQGTGLGLAIVKSIIERHGGRVRVESALNKGSTFTITVPMRPPPPEEGD